MQERRGSRRVAPPPSPDRRANTPCLLSERFVRPCQVAFPLLCHGMAWRRTVGGKNAFSSFPFHLTHFLPLDGKSHPLPSLGPDRIHQQWKYLRSQCIAV